MKISELPKATAVNDTDVIPLVQEGETKQASRKAVVGVVPNDLKMTDRLLQLTASGEAVGDGITLPDFDKFELWNDITLSEDVQRVSISRTDDGKPVNIKKLFLIFTGKTDKANPSLSLFYNNTYIYQMFKSFITSNADETFTVWACSEKIAPGVFRSVYSNKALTVSNMDFIQGLGDANGELGGCIYHASDISVSYASKANNWSFGNIRSEDTLKSGSRILVWGVQDDD